MVIFTDLIQCPRCGTAQEADIEYEPCDPFPIYVHICEECEHVIMESEWDSLNVDVQKNREFLGLPSESGEVVH